MLVSVMLIKKQTVVVCSQDAERCISTNHMPGPHSQSGESLLNVKVMWCAKSWHDVLTVLNTEERQEKLFPIIQQYIRR